MEAVKKHSSRKILIIGLVCFLLLCTAGLGWFIASQYFIKPEINKKEVQQSQKKTSVENNSVENNSLLVQTQFLFAKTDTANNKSEIYRRPPGKDESIKVIELPGILTAGKYSRLANNVAFVVGSDVYASKDGGESFQKIFTGPVGEDITSIRFSKHQARLTIAVSSSYGEAAKDSSFGNKVISINSDGSDEKTLFTTKDIGIYIKDWSVNAGKVLYQSGCNRCDQVPRTTNIYDLKTKVTTKLPLNDTATLGNLVLNDAATRVTYTTAFHDANIQIYDSLDGSYYGPPYSFYQYDIALKKNRLALRIGKKVSSPKSTKDIPGAPVIATAGTKYGRQHYYLYQNSISLLYDDNSTHQLLNIPGTIRDVLFVSEAQVLAITGTDQSWSLISFDPKSEGQQVLFKGDSAITPLGMSDQF